MLLAASLAAWIVLALQVHPIVSLLVLPLQVYHIAPMLHSHTSFVLLPSHTHDHVLMHKDVLHTSYTLPCAHACTHMNAMHAFVQVMRQTHRHGGIGA
jgi:hypothetical protein